ncbi:MAG: VWA domain-containing protein [Deltaproteobacteria bacterium]|nr:VWA domain-containing protein [Deltaproteobacteria bacterium]
MVPTAHRVRTGIALAAASGTIVAALLLHARPAPPVTAVPSAVDAARDHGDDGVRLTARLPAAKMPRGPHEELLAVTIAAPKAQAAGRPPVSVAIVLDRSASMSDAADGSSTPWAHAKAAAARLVDQLADGDAVSIIGYADGGATYLPIALVDDATKRRARAVLAEMENESGGGATCISCGLATADGELSRSQVTSGVHRILLISDGQANATVSGRDGDVLDAKDEAIALAAKAASHGASVTAMGVGLGFDEGTMIRIADVGRGNYYFVDDARDLPRMFEAELGGLAATVATNAKLLLSDGDGVTIEEALGYPMSRVGDHVIVPISDLRVETRKVVFRVAVAPARTGPMALAKVELGWLRPGDGANRRAATTATVDVVDDPAAITASIDPATAASVDAALGALTLEVAARAYDRGGSPAALQVIDAIETPAAIDAVPSFPTATAATIGRARRAFATAPEPRSDAGEKAKKAVREQAHDLAR